jgi:uncharacterized protein with HEPN domain
MDDTTPKIISILKQMAEYCEMINEAIEMFGDSFDIFQSKSLYWSTCCMFLLQIGDLSSDLTNEFKQVYDEVSWKDVKTLRNIGAKNYGDINYALAWSAIHESIPKLARFCEMVINQYNAIIKVMPDDEHSMIFTMMTGMRILMTFSSASRAERSDMADVGRFLQIVYRSALFQTWIGALFIVSNSIRKVGGFSTF